MENFVELLRSSAQRQHRVVCRSLEYCPQLLLKALGHTDEIKIPETEYDNLFVLFPKSEGAADAFCVFGSTKLLIVNISHLL